MQRTEEGIPEEKYELVVLHGGRRYKRRNNGVEKGELHNELEGR
jgi:hypothetical protein